MSPTKIVEMLDRLFARSGLDCSQNSVEDNFMAVLSKADGKKAGNPEFDPTLHELTDTNSFWVGCHDRSGALVGTAAARLLDLDAFMDSCRSYRLWYGEKIRFMEPLDIVEGAVDRLPVGRTSFVGAVWVRPDWRGRGLSWALMRLCYYTAMVRWRLDWVMAMVFAGIARARIPTVDYGFPRCDLLASGYRVPGFSRQQLFLLTMSRLEALENSARDHQYLAQRPQMRIDRTFGDLLRARRLTDPDLAIAS